MFTEGSRTHAFVSAVSSAIIHSTIAATCESTESMAGRGEVSGGTTRPISVHERVTASTPHQLYHNAGTLSGDAEMPGGWGNSSKAESSGAV